MSLLTLPKELIGYLCGKGGGITFLLLRTCKGLRKKTKDHLMFLYLNTRFTRNQIREYVSKQTNNVTAGKQVTHPINYFNIPYGGNNLVPIINTISFMTDVRTEIEDNIYTPVNAESIYFSNIDNKMVKMSKIGIDETFYVKYDNLENSPHLYSLKISAEPISLTLLHSLVRPTPINPSYVIVDVYTFSCLLTSRGSFSYTDEERLELVQKHYSKNMFTDDELKLVGMSELVKYIFEPGVISPSKLVPIPPPMIMDPIWPLFE